MLVRNEVIFKWLLYAAAALLCVLAQDLILGHLQIWGVIPFLYPLLAVIPATFTRPVPGTVFALCVGVLCDLLLPGCRCFHTLLFPLLGMAAALLSKSLLPHGPLCSLAATAAAFALTGFFHCLVLWSAGKAAWSAGAWVALREFCVSVPLILPVTFLFQAVAERTEEEEL